MMLGVKLMLINYWKKLKNLLLWMYIKNPNKVIQIQKL